MLVVVALLLSLLLLLLPLLLLLELLLLEPLLRPPLPVMAPVSISLSLRLLLGRFCIAPALRYSGGRAGGFASAARRGDPVAEGSNADDGVGV